MVELTRGADLVIKSLAGAGVSRIFALSGNQIMPLFDACIDAGVEIVHTRHEAACVYMAEAHAQLTGELGVTLVTAGVGLGNAVGPLYCALASETPVLLLSGDSPVAQDGNGAFQELSQTHITQAVTRYATRPGNATALRRALIEAFASATGSVSGPVHLALPADVLTQDATGVEPPTLAPQSSGPPPDADTIKAVQADLLAAQRPLILLGPALNATRQPDLVARLQSTTGAALAIAESPRGLDDPRYRALGTAISDADRILLLGKRCDFSLGFGQTASADCRWTLVHADASAIEQARHNLGERDNHFVHADPISLARALSSVETSQLRSRWLQHSAEYLAAPQPPDFPADTEPLHPATVCDAVQAAIAASRDPILIVDGGEFGQWAQALCHAPRRVINGIAGSIGGAIPAAIAASLAFPSADVFVLMGDGSAGFHIAELDTAVRCGASFTLVIGNDQRWNAEHQIQLRNYGPNRLIGCDLGDAGYWSIAIALGAKGFDVKSKNELQQALSSSRHRLTCLDVRIQSHPAP